MKILKNFSTEQWIEARKKVLTSTDIPSLFNCSPYCTLFETWHFKKGLINPQTEETQRMKWGNRLEEAIAKGIAEDKGWIIRPKKEFIYDENLRIGSSFDYEIVLSNDNKINALTGSSLLEIKNIDSLAFKNNWIVSENGDVEASLYVELQIQHQLLVSGLEKAFVAALVGGNTPVVIERNRDEDVIKQIVKKSEDFWKSIDNNTPPKPDFEKDKDAIRELYKAAKKGKAVEGTMQVKELAETYSNLTEQIAALNKKRDAIKMQMLTMMGDAEKIIGEGYQVSAGVVQRAGYEVKPVVYRDFRIRFMEK